MPADLRFESCCLPGLVTPHRSKGNNIPKHSSSVVRKKAAGRDALRKVCLYPARGYAVACSRNYRNEAQAAPTVTPPRVSICARRAGNFASLEKGYAEDELHVRKHRRSIPCAPGQVLLLPSGRAQHAQREQRLSSVGALRRSPYPAQYLQQVQPREHRSALDCLRFPCLNFRFTAICTDLSAAP